MFRVSQYGFGSDFRTMQEAVGEVRKAEATRAEIVESDGVYMIQRMRFESGVMVSFEVNINGDRMVNVMEEAK